MLLLSPQSIVIDPPLVDIVPEYVLAVIVNTSNRSIVSFVELDSPASFLTLKYTVLVPELSLNVNEGLDEYVVHEAPENVLLSLAM